MLKFQFQMFIMVHTCVHIVINSNLYTYNHHLPWAAMISSTVAHSWHFLKWNAMSTLFVFTASSNGAMVFYNETKSRQ